MFFSIFIYLALILVFLFVSSRLVSSIGLIALLFGFGHSNATPSYSCLLVHFCKRKTLNMSEGVIFAKRFPKKMEREKFSQYFSIIFFQSHICFSLYSASYLKQKLENCDMQSNLLKNYFLEDKNFQETIKKIIIYFNVQQVISCVYNN